MCNATRGGVEPALNDRVYSCEAGCTTHGVRALKPIAGLVGSTVVSTATSVNSCTALFGGSPAPDPVNIQGFSIRWTPASRIGPSILKFTGENIVPSSSGNLGFVMFDGTMKGSYAEHGHTTNFFSNKAPGQLCAKGKGQESLKIVSGTLNL